MRQLRTWMPMALVIGLMLTLGGRMLSSSEARLEQARAPLRQDPYDYQEPSDDPIATATSPGDEPATATLAAETPTTDPAQLPTITPDPFFPTDPPPQQEQPTDTILQTETPTIAPTITPTPITGQDVACDPGTAVELNGGDGFLTPNTRLLVYLDTPIATSPTPLVAEGEGSFSASDSDGAFGGTGGGDLPTSALPGGGAGGAGGQVVGSGFVRYDGFFRLALAVEQLRPGTYPVQVRERDSQLILGRFICTISGARPTVLALTPGLTPFPEPGNQLACIQGDQLQITGRGTPRTPLLVSFDGREAAGGSVFDDGTFNIPLIFDERRAGAYRVTVTERGSRRQLTTFTCLVPTRPTITPINDRPS